jgi:hypothetical protein
MMSIQFIEGRLGKLIANSLGKGWRCVAVKECLIPNSSLYFFSSFKTGEVGFRMLVVDSMCSIVIDPMFDWT